MGSLRWFNEMFGWDEALLGVNLIALAGWALYGVNLIWGLSKPLQILALLLLLPWLILTIVDLVRKTKKRQDKGK